LITIPNSTFNTNAVTNYSRTGKTQVKIPLSFKSGTNLGKVSEIMNIVTKSTQGVRPDNIEVLVTGMTTDDSEWNAGVELRFWINRISNRDDVISKVLSGIKEELAKEKLIPIQSAAEEGGFER
jgi:small-conductance mechanosensitive channel